MRSGVSYEKRLPGPSTSGQRDSEAQTCVSESPTHVLRIADVVMTSSARMHELHSKTIISCSPQLPFVRSVTGETGSFRRA